MVLTVGLDLGLEEEIFSQLVGVKFVHVEATRLADLSTLVDVSRLLAFERRSHRVDGRAEGRENVLGTSIGFLSDLTLLMGIPEDLASLVDGDHGFLAQTLRHHRGGDSATPVFIIISGSIGEIAFHRVERLGSHFIPAIGLSGLIAIAVGGDFLTLGRLAIVGIVFHRFTGVFTTRRRTGLTVTFGLFSVTLTGTTLTGLAFFSLIALVVTAGTVAVFGESLTEPTDIIERVNSVPLTIVAALMFFAATVGINLVANFIPPAYDLANLMPSKINFRVGGLITSAFALVIGGLWVSTISQIGIFNFVNTLGAILAPVYGIMITDYYMIKGGKLDVEQLFSADESGLYYYDNGWNRTALIAFGLAGIFSVATVWVPALADLSGFAWVIGAVLGGGLYFVLARR